IGVIWGQRSGAEQPEGRKPGILERKSRESCGGRPGARAQPGRGTDSPGTGGGGSNPAGSGALGREFQPGFGGPSRERKTPRKDSCPGGPAPLGFGDAKAASPELPWLAQLEDLRNELEKRQAKKSAEVSPREAPAQGQEEKSQQPDVRSSLSRCGKVTFQLPLEAAPEERVCHFWRSSALKETLGKLQASVTLDPDTAHPELRLSEDGKRVWRGAAPRPLPERPERFELWPFVLGHQGFAAGRHCWHVDVGDGGDWAVGVARESVPRKGRLSLGPQGGIWALEKWGGQLRALTARRVTPVGARALPRRVSVHLDCGGGSVAFLDARDGELLFAFSRAAFGGERLRPWLWVVGARSQLRLCP
ncbi:butyrophilin subfamily 1 member A1-like, partial [Haemorhous mexicanus]|uniref:butyrophilin subfamily 1 member A1-like n=1 Tax=Haemorhous mexicanus TaxID=30427 RepID=UPI0028BEB946